MVILCDSSPIQRRAVHKHHNLFPRTRLLVREDQSTDRPLSADPADILLMPLPLRADRLRKRQDCQALATRRMARPIECVARNDPSSARRPRHPPQDVSSTDAVVIPEIDPNYYEACGE